MSTKRYFIWTTVLVTVFFIGCESVQQALSLNKPTARMTGLKFENVKLDSATLLFDVEVENHYSVPLPLMNLDYGLSSGAEPFLTGSADLQTTVPANSKKTVSLPATINYLDMLRALKGISPGEKIPYEADLTLSVDAPALGPLKLPLKKEGEVVLPTPSSTDIKNIWDVIKPD